MPDCVMPQGGVVVPLDIDASDAFAGWAHDPHVAWLESGGPINARSRHHYLCVEPFHVIERDDPWDELAETLARYRQPNFGPVPFFGGAVGFLEYELGAALQNVPRHSGLAGVPACSIGFYDVVLAFDRTLGRAWLLSSGLPETNPARREARAACRARSVLARLAQCQPLPRADIGLDWSLSPTLAVHSSRVARAIAYIEAGDIYQANITAAFGAVRPPGLTNADIHMALRAKNPAPFTAFIGAGKDIAVASVSPERFLSLDASGCIEARPIKGTRPRDADPARDAAWLAQLQSSPKDLAENLMIVDLLRHDIGRVAEIGSVHVPELACAESFASVHHLVSCVRGRLRAGACATDLLRAAFPGGSITGAPKRRAMQIIHEIEPAARGAYCGSVVWMGWDGAMDSSIAIRTAQLSPGRVIIQAGGGIVADSDPADEYEEVLVKARPLLRALGPFPR